MSSHDRQKEAEQGVRDYMRQQRLLNEAFLEQRAQPPKPKPLGEARTILFNNPAKRNPKRAGDIEHLDRGITVDRGHSKKPKA